MFVVTWQWRDYILVISIDFLWWTDTQNNNILWFPSKVPFWPYFAMHLYLLFFWYYIVKNTVISYYNYSESKLKQSYAWKWKARSLCCNMNIEYCQRRTRFENRYFHSSQPRLVFASCDPIWSKVRSAGFNGYLRKWSVHGLIVHCEKSWRRLQKFGVVL